MKPSNEAEDWIAATGPAIEDAEDIRAAIDELLNAVLIIRVRP